jgi:hypothetical protein
MRTLVALNRTIVIDLPDSLPALKCAQLAEAIDKTLHSPVHIVSETVDGKSFVLFDTAIDEAARFVMYRERLCA